MNLNAIAKDFGGDVRGDKVFIPTPGHSAKDRGTCIEQRPDAPDGLLVHSFNGGDPLAIKDALRDRGHLPKFEPHCRTVIKSAPKPIKPEIEFIPAATFDYHNIDGDLAYQVRRIDKADGGKEFPVYHPDGQGGWLPGRGGDAVLYRLLDIVQAPSDAIIFMVEGERKADKLAAWGFPATSSKNLPNDLKSVFEGRTVAMLPDNDEPGKKIADKAEKALKAAGASCFTFTLPGLPDKGDILDWGGSALDLIALTEAAQSKLGNLSNKLPPIDVAVSVPENKKATAFEFVRVGNLQYQPPEFLIDELFETETLGLLFGDPGCGKSFLAVDIGLSVATGMPFHGRSVKKGPVFFIAGEGHNGLVRRFAAWAKYRDISIENAPLFKSTRAAQFLDAESAKSVADAVNKLAGTYGHPALIIIDTLARNFGPGDENSTSDMSAFVAAIDELKAGFPGCAVLIVHHSGHAEKGRARGAMALKGALDSEYRADMNQSRITLACTKMKDAEPPRALAFAFKPIELDGGASSAVLELTDMPEKQDRLTPAQKLAQETFIDAAVNSDIKSDDGFSWVSLDGWRDEFYAMHTADNTDAKRKAFGRARKDLQTANLIAVANNEYRWIDEAVAMEITKKRKGGTSGTARDKSAKCPVAEAE